MAEGNVADAYNSLRLVASAFSGREDVDAFRETYGRALMQLEINPHPDHPFEIDFVVGGFDGFGFASGRLSPSTNRHTSAMIEDNDIVLVYTPQGHGNLKQLGRETELRSGEAVFTTNGEFAECDGHVLSELRNFRFSRGMLGAMADDIDDALMRRIDRDHPVLRLLARYAELLGDGTAIATPEMRESVSAHMHDMAALLLGPTRDGGELARGRGVRAARLRAIKQDIAANLTSRALSVDALARRHAISPRTIRDLFGSEGTTFTDHVLAERLARAHRLLLDPRMAGRTIAAIAFDCGFGDLSYFNHAFRRRYAATPSDVRNGTTAQD